MKLGVFGDSFANKQYLNSQQSVIWYNFLQREHGHTVDCFGESGSSIEFSAQLIKQHANNYDLVIWCLTIPGRFSFSQLSKDYSYHITNAFDKCYTKDSDLIKKHEVCVDYFKYIFDWETENLIGESIVSYIQTKFPNIMIIPCFFSPLNYEFHLYKLCQQESEQYFPGQQLHEVYKSYQDLRPGHFTPENQKILAKLINDKLTPGIFQTSYDNFVKPVAPFNQLFQKK
jgi:hypothetical protein